MQTQLDPITQEVLNYFMELTNIPRKSGYEEAVSEHLYQWAKARNFNVVKDKVHNIIIDKPADIGCESKPLTILQGHMDMVCVADEGYPYHPLTDPIHVINHDNVTLTADHTSLGADDGIGVAIAQYILASGKNCGPLRVIFTVNEEELMLGAKEIEECYLDAKYMINLDSENDTILTNSCAGGMCVNVTKKPKTTSPLHDKAIKLSICGLQGGHSGVEINKGRLNAVRAISYALLVLDQNGVSYDLCSIQGGTGDNVIPKECTALLVVSSKDMDKFEQIYRKINDHLKKGYEHTGENIQFTYTPANTPNCVLSEQDKNCVITYTTQITNGVHTMSPTVPSLVQSSSNLGIIKADSDNIFLSIYWRSSHELFIEQMHAQNMALAQMFDMTYAIKSREPGWANNPKSVIQPLIAKIYEEQNSTEMIVEAIHAGLECGWFYSKNPELDLVSVGPNLKDVHSTSETLEIASISKTLNLVLETLQRL